MTSGSADNITASFEMSACNSNVSYNKVNGSSHITDDNYVSAHRIINVSVQALDGRAYMSTERKK